MAVRWRLIYAGIFLLACIAFILSLWDLFFEKGLKFISFLFYFILIAILCLVYMFIKTKKSKNDIVALFEKTLKGRLYHFKCPQCEGIFALKESLYNNHQPMVLTCPDCGHPGRILPIHKVTLEKIPLKKSENILLRCSHCGESIKIWAEGTRLYPYVKVFSCPFCGAQKPLKRI